MAVYDAGDSVTYQGTFTSGGALADPGTVRFRLEPPGQPGTTYTHAAGTITNHAVGSYSYTVLLAFGGYWGWRWEGTETVSQAHAGRDFVRYVE